MNFTNKVVLITGGGSGIGAGTAEYLSKLNAKLVLVGRNEKNLIQVAEKCKANGAEQPLVIAADVTKDTEKIINKTLDHFNQLDVLVNNAGILTYSTIEAATMDEYDMIMNTNLRAVFELTKYAVPHLIATKGNIINVSSIAGHRSLAGTIIYCMSKAGLDQFTKCMSLDLAAKGVRVNSVNPGTIVTDIFTRSGFDEDRLEKFLAAARISHPLGRVGDVSEVASVIAFLADDKLSGFMTGAILPIDGGRYNSCPR